MIGKIYPAGGSFKGLISYLESGKGGLRPDRVAWVEFYSLPTRKPRVAACYMAATARSSISCTRTPLYHFSVSFAPDDPVDEAMLRRVAKRTLRNMELEEYECVVFAHRDRSHLHLHFVVCRVHPVRRTLWRNWRDRTRLEYSLRAQEVEFGLQIVPGWLAPVPTALNRARDGYGQGQQPEGWIKPQPGPRRGNADFLRDVTERAAPVLAQARSWAELERGLAEQGLSLRVKGGGFRITDGKHQVKASEVGRDFSRYHLEKRLGGYPDYRARMAVAGIAPVLPLSPAQPEALEQQEVPPAPTQTPVQQPEQASPPAPPLATSEIDRAFSRARLVHGENPFDQRLAARVADQERTPESATADAGADRTGPASRPEPAAPTAPDTPGSLRPALRPQFGDAGHGINELFGHAPELRQPDALARGPQPERAAPAVELGSTIQPERGDAVFLREVRERAGPVLEAVRSWEELERGLAEHGLSLRVTGGGFTVTDGAREVKASEVGRAFSRYHLEKRLGGYPGDRTRMAAAGIAPAPPASPPSLPPSMAPAEAPGPELHVRSGPQFGDAGHGVAELFGYAQTLERERPGTAEERVPAPQPELVPPPVPSLATPTGAGLSDDAPVIRVPEPPGEPAPELIVPAPPVEPRVAVPAEPSTLAQAKRRQVEFLREVKERATTVLERAGSWVELECGLADLGLSLRVKGGGFTVTDGELEVKASDVGRAFSRFHLEKRLGRYPDSPVDVRAPELSPTPPAPADQLDALEPPLESAATPHPTPAPGAVSPSAPPQATVREAQPLRNVEPERERAPAAAPEPERTVQPDREREAAKAPSLPKPGERASMPATLPRQDRPRTRAERYRLVLRAFAAELIDLYADPRAARRAFAQDVLEHGTDRTLASLTAAPERYGAMLPGAGRERAAWALDAAELYAQWQAERMRPALRWYTELLRPAIPAELAEHAVTRAWEEDNAALEQAEPFTSAKTKAERAKTAIWNKVLKVYAEPERAVESLNACMRTKGKGLREVLRVLRDAPAGFGALRAVKRPRRYLPGTYRDYTPARKHALTLANLLETRPRAPKDQDVKQVEARVRETRAALVAALDAQRKLARSTGSDPVRTLAHVLQSALRDGADAERLARQLAAMLPAGAEQLAAKAISLAAELARGPEQQRERSRGIEL